MPNKLIDQTSPYLLQHAHNPVNWHPWRNEALEIATSENKPILLSIGYAACHWCHVMEKESFENPQIAEIMNEHFVCIKVDREERPDLDKIYQLAHQMLTQKPGGWPLTIALTPKGHAPFFAGTYFPPEARFNMPGFPELLVKISGHFHEKQDQLSDYHLSFNAALEKLNPVRSSSRESSPFARFDKTLRTATETLEKQFDDTFGGFGDAPKFPHPTQIQMLLIPASRPAKASQETQTTTDSPYVMIEKSLIHMAQGGLFDHLAGGFFRYSVDRQWQIPHFEKMLYDNAQLLNVYSYASQLYNNPLFENAAKATANWTISEMQQDHGGFAATLDADSEGQEGKFYVWNETDLRAVLSEDEYRIVENTFGLYGEPNFEGTWHFNLNVETDHVLLNQNPEIKESIDQVKAKLLNLRNERIRPGLDTKVLTSWNGLMISAMAIAARVFNQTSFIESAQESAEFIKNNMWKGNRLLASYNMGKSQLNGYLDDYAFMLCGILDLLQSKWRQTDFEFAINIADTLLERFEDKDDGGFYFTSHDHEKLLYRPKTGADDAIPSGNAAAISGLLGLGNLLGEPRYLESAEKALELFEDELERHPSVNASMSTALQKLSPDFSTIIIRGKCDDSNIWSNYVHRHFRPGIQCFTIPDNLKNLPPSLAMRKPQKTTVAYVCQGKSCTPPMTDLEQLQQYLL